MKTTAVFYDDLCTYHEMGYMHPESPRRLLAVKEVLDGEGIGRELARLGPRDATEDEIAFIHDENYIRRIKVTDGGELVALDPDTSANAYTWKAALRAAGGTLACVDFVLQGKARNAYAFVRPPGHHAERARAMGFCIFNNIAIAAESLIKKGGVGRVAIVDFDVHHGNGTQHAFYRRGDVFFASMHRFPFYPGTGAADETGEGLGKGATLNVPLPAGSDDDDHRRALCDRIIPAVERFAPEFLLVSSGFDGHVKDPLGGMRVTTAGFREMMASLVELAATCCDSRLVVVLEGGYDLSALSECAEASLEEMIKGG